MSHSKSDLEKILEKEFESLPKDYRYRVTYDQTAKIGRWRIVGLDAKFQAAFGGAGPTLSDAITSAQITYDQGERWNVNNANEST